MAEAWLRDEDEALLAAARLARERAYALLPLPGGGGGARG